MGDIYNRLLDSNKYDEKTQQCIKNTITKLGELETDIQKPGLLLGKIQSGKTRTFIGIIGLAFDEGYDCSIVLTKANNLLTKQTYERLNREFEKEIDNDTVEIFDIMKSSESLTRYILNKKIIIVAKKQKHNIDRLVRLFKSHDVLKNKKVLIIDDEADHASIGFKKDKESLDGVSINVIAKQIDELREQSIETSFLQVTATPTSLFLQPEDNATINNTKHLILKPAFTELVPIHNQYVGSDFYFGDESENPTSPAYHLYIPVPDKELQVLGKEDQRYLLNILKTPNLVIFRMAIINFLVGGTIRGLQEGKPLKYSCMVHTETVKKKHNWQCQVVNKLVKELRDTATKNARNLKQDIKRAYDNFKESVCETKMPSFQKVYDETIKAIQEEYISIKKINSEPDLESLMDREGQLKLDHPFNIFIGGQILDRGITIRNLISTFYGRSPKKFQQDTVLQHSRMYGARSNDDMRVTRFYTGQRIYDSMRKIHYLDEVLRENLEEMQNSDDSRGLAFLNYDKSGTVIPCPSNKLLISALWTVKKYKRFIPTGMQTVAKKEMKPIEVKISAILNNYKNRSDDFQKTFRIEKDDALEIINLIKKSYDYSESNGNKGKEWDHEVVKGIIIKLLSQAESTSLWCLVKKDRNVSRFRKNKITFSDAPEDGNTDLKIAREKAINLPMLMLLQQNGKKEDGWKDTPFWWPSLMVPKNVEPFIFSGKKPDMS